MDSQNLRNAKLDHRGTTDIGGAGRESMLLKTDPSGAISVPPGSVVIPTPAGVAYVDASIGSDVTGDGSIGAPYATLTKAVAENVIAGASDMTIFLGPGTYAAPTVSDAAQDNIAIHGVSQDQTTITGTLTFASAAAINTLSLFDLSADTVSDLNVGGTFNVDLYAAILATATSANVANTGVIVITPVSSVTSTTNITRQYEPDADSVGYSPTVPADWSPAPSEAGPALDQLADRTTTLEEDKVDGPGVAVDDNLAAFDGVTGKIIKDSGIALANVVQGPASAIDEAIAVYDGITGKLIKDSTVLISDLFTGPGSAVDENIAVFDGITGKLVKDSLISINDVVIGPASAVNENIAIFDLTTGKVIKDSGIPISGLGDSGKMAVNSSDTTLDYSDVKLPVTGALSEIVSDAGGLDLTRTLGLDIDALTEETVIAGADDWLILHDDDAAGDILARNRKISLPTLMLTPIAGIYRAFYTQAINFKVSSTQTAMFLVPTGLRLQIDDFDVVVDKATPATDTPTMQLGISGTPDMFLSPTKLDLSMVVVNKREIFPINSDAIGAGTVIEVGVTIAGISAGDYEGTVVLRGYLLPIPGGSPAATTGIGFERVDFTADGVGTVAGVKFVTLTPAPVDPDSVVVRVRGAASQVEGSDYIVSGNQVSWVGLGLETLLILGSEIEITYAS